MQKQEAWENKYLVLFVVVTILFSLFYQEPRMVGMAVESLQGVVLGKAGSDSEAQQQLPTIPVPSPRITQPSSQGASPPTTESQLSAATGQSRVYVEINLKVTGENEEVTSTQYACASEDSDLFKAFERSLTEYGNPAPSLPETIYLGQQSESVPNTQIHWSQSIKDYVEGTGTSEQQDTFRGIAFINGVDCESLKGMQATLASATSSPIQVQLTQDVGFFAAAGIDAGTCSFLHQASRGSNNPYYVFITDTGFNDFVAGNAGGNAFWGDPLKQEDVDKLFDHYYLDRIFAMPPFQDFRDTINVMHFKSDKNYPSCDTTCNFAQIQTEMISTCSMQAVQNFKMIMLHGVSSFAANYFGLAYFNSPYTQTMVGSWTYLSKGGKTSFQLKEIKGNELAGVIPYIFLHELGHTYNIDHTTCEFLPLNKVLGICFTKGNCASTTGDECEPNQWNSNEEVVVTRTDKSVVRGYGFMYPGLASFIPATSYQEVGKVHIERINRDVLKNRFWMASNAVCGNSLVDEGEDADHNQGYSYDVQRKVVGTCMQMENGVAEMLHQYPTAKIGQEAKAKFFGSVHSVYTPLEAGPVTLNTNTCQLFHECAAAEIGKYSAYTQIFGTDYQRLGFIPPAPVDCTKVDYRLPPGIETTTFSDPTNPAQSGRQTCNFNNHPSFNTNAPFLPQEDHTLVYAYQKEVQGTKTIEAGIMDVAGNVIQKTTLPFPSGLGNLRALSYAETSKPQDWAHNYDPYSQPAASFASFTHPITLVAAFENAIALYRFLPNFLAGVDPVPSYTISLPAGQVFTKLIDAGHDASADEFVITMLTTDATNDRAYQIRLPTQGQKLQTVTPTLMIGNLNQHNVLARTFALSPDKKALVSVEEGAIPAGSFLFTQQLAGQATALTRTLPLEEQLPNIVQARVTVAADNFGRYTFSSVDSESSIGIPLTINHHTLTSGKILRQDFDLPITGLTKQKSLYHTSPLTDMLVKETMDGPIIATPIEIDQAIALVDEERKVTLQPAYIPPLFAPHDPFAAVTAVEQHVYYNTVPIKRPVDTDVRPVLLTRVNLPGTFYPAARVYLGRSTGGYTIVDLATVSNPQATLSHFAIFATSVGASTPPAGGATAFTCAERGIGFASTYAGRVWSKKGEEFLMSKAPVNFEPTSFDLYTLANNPYGVAGNKLVGSITIPRNVWVIDTAINPTIHASSNTGGTLTAIPPSNSGLVLVTERDARGNIDLYAYLLDFNTGAVSKGFGPLPYKTSQSGFLMGAALCTEDFLSNDLYCCNDVRTCNQLTEEVTIPGTGTNTIRKAWNDHLVAYTYTDSTPATYIYDFKVKQLYTHPQKALYIAIENDIITLVSQQGNQVVVETLQVSSGALQIVGRKAIVASLGTNRQISGVLEVNGNTAVVVIDQGLIKKLEVVGDQYATTNAVCSQGQLFTGNIVHLQTPANKYFTAYDLTSGVSRVFDAGTL